MIQFLNNLTSVINITNFMYLLSSIIEGYLFITMLLVIFDVKTSYKQKLLHIFLIVIISNLSLKFIPSPFNVVVNYFFTTLSLKLIFKIKPLKGFLALVITSFAFGILNTLIQKPYLSVLHISLDTFTANASYRLHYFAILYSLFYCLIIFLKKFKNINVRLNLLDSLDKNTEKILFINSLLGLVILIVQLVLTDYYIDIVPPAISLLNLILLIAFLALSLFSFSRIIQLATTERRLSCAEEYNKSLKILYDKVNGFKHDFDNIIYFLDGYIENNDMDGLRQYFNEVKKDFKITHNLSLLNPNIINNPGIYSLLNNEYFKALKLGINFEIEVFLNINELEINIYNFSRILGVLLDNAIEATEKCTNKIVKISFVRDNSNSRAIITIQNTYANKDVDIEKIFNKGISSKENHSGIGLWEVDKFIKKSKNLDLKPSKDDKYFKQELFIYDL